MCGASAHAPLTNSRSPRRSTLRSCFNSAELFSSFGMIHLEVRRRLKDRVHLEQAGAIFTEIGAGWGLAQVQKLLEVTPETVRPNSGHT